ncbi:MAG: hypothetical protein PUF80_00550 [Firmicutes bacterium]|nr:hypothetical protein [Bacillota bacterium]
MTDRFISREWLEDILNHYNNIRCWNSSVVDCDTVLSVLEVLENEIKRAPTISSRQLGNRMMKVKDVALEAQLRVIDLEIEESRAEYRLQESKGNAMLMGFCKGMLVAREEVRCWLKRMVNDRKAPD